MNKNNLKEYGKICWEFLAFIAYLKFYIFCLAMGGVVLVLSVFVLAEHGGNYETIANKIPTVMYWMTFWVLIIMIDKFVKEFKGSSKTGAEK